MTDNITNKPVSAADKRLILGHTDVLQLFPVRYQWAWDHYLESQQNHWTPNDIQMSQDIADYNDSALPMAWRHRFETVLAQLTTFDLQRGMDLGETLLKFASAPELKMAIMRQAEEESRHSWSYQYCIENMGIDQARIYNMYREVPELFNRVIFARQFSERVDRLTTGDLNTTHGKTEFLLGLIFWYLIFEGLWFFVNLAGPIQSISRHRRFTATAEQFQYILRDESVHLNFGIDFINEFIKEYPQVWTFPTIEKIQKITLEAIELERKFISYACMYQSLDYTVDDHMEMCYWYINQRMHSIGIQEEWYPQAKCSMPWMSEVIDLKKEKNFFETRVTEYQKGSFDSASIKPGLNLDWP